MKRSKSVTPKWVDRLLVFIVISLLRFLLRHSGPGICKYTLTITLDWFVDLMAVLSPSKGRASVTASGKRHSQ